MQQSLKNTPFAPSGRFVLSVTNIPKIIKRGIIVPKKGPPTIPGLGWLSRWDDVVRANAWGAFGVLASRHEQPVAILQQLAEVIRLVVMMYVRYPPSLRNVEDLSSTRAMRRCGGRRRDEPPQ